MKTDWVYIIAMTFILSSASFSILLYINILNQHECLKNPLVYAAKIYTEEVGYEFLGTGSFITKGESPIIYFDSRGIYEDRRPIINNNSLNWSN